MAAGAIVYDSTPSTGGGMSLLGDAAFARKAGNLAASLFPSLGAVWDALERRVRESWRGGWLHRFVAALRRTRAGNAFADVVGRFWWSRMSSERPDWSKMPAEGASLLRAGLVLCALLLVLMPAAATFAVEGEGAPLWSATAVSVGLLGARALLLTGAACSNRAVFAFVALLDLYVAFGLATCGAAGRSWGSLALPLPALAALVASEATLGGHRHGVRGLAVALLVGGGAGFVLGLVLPPSQGVGPVKLAVGVPLGMALGVALLALGARSRRFGAARLAGLLFALEALGLAAAVGRAGLRAVVAFDAELANLVGGLLWPLWYFVGVGITFKLLGAARDLVALARELLPARRLGLVAVALLAAASLLLWLPSVLDAPTLPWPEALVSAAVLAYRATRFLWLQNDLAFAAELYRWLLLAMLGWGLAQALRRRLDAPAASALLFTALLGWFGCYEYYFEQLGFLRSAPHTATALFVFGVWLLWLLQRVGQLLGMGKSPAWPATARLALLGGVLVLVMAQLCAKGSARSGAFVSEVFLTLYRAFIDVGVPYSLYLWASRKAPSQPLAPAQLLWAFALGALATLPFHALDHLAASRLDALSLLSTMRARGEAALSGDLLSLFADPPPPPAWVALRGLGLFALLAAAGARVARTRSGSAAGAWLLAASAGFASFSRATLDLPLLPPWLTALFAPLRQTFELDAYVLGSFLAYPLPALAMALAAARLRGSAHPWAKGAAVGLAVHLLFAVPWPRDEAWLRSTGVLWTAGLAGAVALAWLVARLRAQLDAVPARAGLAVPVVLAALGAVAGLQAVAERSTPRSVGDLAFPLAVPAGWSQLSAPPGVDAAFARASLGLLRPVLLASLRPGAPADALAAAADEAQKNLAGFELRAVARRPVAMRVAGAERVDFAYTQQLGRGLFAPVAGTTLAARAGGRTLLLTWVGLPGDWDRQQWDLARIVSESGLR